LYSNDQDILRHIHEETQYLLSKHYVTYDELIASPTLQRAFVRSIEVIGEATKKLSELFRDNNKEIDWKAIAGMRDKLIHDYFGVDYQIVYDVVKNEIPKLNNVIEKNNDQLSLF